MTGPSVLRWAILRNSSMAYGRLIMTSDPGVSPVLRS